jgi:hypothetical protein
MIVRAVPVPAVNTPIALDSVIKGTDHGGAGGCVMQTGSETRHLSRALRWVAASTLVALASCGGGGGSSGSTPPTGPTGMSPPTGLSYSTPQTYLLNQAITPLKPTVTGTVTAYQVGRSLPQGLSLDTSTGVISGAPSITSSTTTYTVTASNSAGSTSAAVSITVKSSGSAPSIAYASPYYSFTVGAAAQVHGPAVSSGPISSWSVEPALPAGLSLSQTDGSILGTPTAGSSPTTYQVSALNTGGTATANLTLAVNGTSLIDLGHSTGVIYARLVGSTLLTQDNSGHWVLWSYASGQNVVNGTAAFFNPEDNVYEPNPVDLEGSTIVLQTSSGLEVRATPNGQVLAEIPGTFSWWKLASDGSYICAGNATGLSAWSPAGTLQFTRSGNYSNAVVYAGPAQIEVALGAAGNSVIETIAVPSGISTVSPAFQGSFASWFIDGGRFLTDLSSGGGGTVWVYSSAAVQQDVAQLPNLLQLGGEGNWYWTVDDCCQLVTQLYKVGSGGSAYASYSPGDEALAMASGSTLALASPYPNYATITIIDLMSASAAATTYTLPVQQSATAYATNGTGGWVAATSGGVVVDGASSPARVFNYGAATAVAGSTTTTAVATASGNVLLFNAASHALQSTVPQVATSLLLSTDGTILAATPVGGRPVVTDFFEGSDASVSIYSLPSLSKLATFPYTLNTAPYLTGIALSGSGTVLGELFSTNDPCVAQTIPSGGGSTLWCNNQALSGITQLALSPDGTLVAASTPTSNGISNTFPTVSIYLNGTLTTSISGYGVVWLNNQTLLVNTYANGNEGIPDFVSANLYSPTGQLISTTGLPGSNVLQPIAPTGGGTPSTVYSPTYNAIYSLSSGAELWSSGSIPDPWFGGAVSGADVVFPAGNLIVAEPHP